MSEDVEMGNQQRSTSYVICRHKIVGEMIRRTGASQPKIIVFFVFCKKM